MKPYILTVTLNPAIDKTVAVPNFRVGKDFREQGMSVSAGGKGINVSRVLKRLNVTNMATGFLGGTNGIYIKQQLDKEKIKYNFCFIKNNTRLSLTVIDPSSNGITRVLERGPQITKQELNTFRKKYLSLLKKCRGVSFCGRNIPGAPDSFYAELIAFAKQRDIFTVLDTSGKPFEVGLRRKPSMIKPNLREAEQILGESLLSLSKIKQAARRLNEYGVGVVAITMGSRGAVAFNGKQMILAIPPHLKRKSPVGCGDAFIAGFLACSIKNKNFAECVKMAVACGAANALSINPGYITQGTLRRLSRQVKLRSLGI